jgi:hypothetical protein
MSPCHKPINIDACTYLEEPALLMPFDMGMGAR